jgi:hypothetical protein
MVMVKIGQDNDGDAGTEIKILYVIVEIILHGNPYAIHPAIFKWRATPSRHFWEDPNNSTMSYDEPRLQAVHQQQNSHRLQCGEAMNKV